MQDEVPLPGSEKLDNEAEINVWFEVALVMFSARQKQQRFRQGGPRVVGLAENIRHYEDA